MLTLFLIQQHDSWKKKSLYAYYNMHAQNGMPLNCTIITVLLSTKNNTLNYAYICLFPRTIYICRVLAVLQIDVSAICSYSH
jgi:hypothetical protein